MEGKTIEMQDLIDLLEDPIVLIKKITTDPKEIEGIINIALNEYLYPPMEKVNGKSAIPILESNNEIPDDVKSKISEMQCFLIEQEGTQ